MFARLVIPPLHLGIAVIGFLIFTSAVVFGVRHDIETFKNGHEQVIENEVTSAALAVEQLIGDRLRLIGVFANERRFEIARLAANPESEVLRAEMTDDLRTWFPSFFTFTIADQNGNDLIADIEGFVGDVCVLSIQRYLERHEVDDGHESHLYEPEIHPQANNYHYDMMTPWWVDGEINGVFFVSFYTDILRGIIESYENEDHTLFIVNRDRENLIEVSSQGARDKFGADRSITLSDWEQASVLAGRDIANSRWQLVGLPKPGLFEDYEQARWAVAFVLILGMAIASCIALIAIGISERHRRDASNAREEANAALSREIAIKNRFFSIIGHDLKSPFTSLLGLSDLMVKMSTKLTNEQMIEYANRINVSGKRVYELLDNLLEWARFQMEKSEIKTSTFDLAETAKDCVDVLTAPAEVKGIKLIADVPTIKVLADPNMILLVIRNLVANSIKFTPKGGSITIAAHTADGFAVVSVTDTGKGIDPAVKEGLFAVDTKTTTLGTDGEIGTGLGLPLCKEMVEANGGQISIDSTPGEGTTFTFTVPLA